MDQKYHSDRTAQQLVSYEALFDLLDKIQTLEDINEISQYVAKRWKYFANAASWRLVINFTENYLVIDGFRGEATVHSTVVLSPWDIHYMHSTKPHLFSKSDFPHSPKPPDHIITKGVSQINVIPFFKIDHCVGLLTVSGRHKPFNELDKKFIHMFGSYLIDKLYSIEQRQRNINILVNKATYDELTGSLNRSTILEYMDILFKKAVRKGKPVSVILADVDHFKQINDTYGHLIGDKMLEQIGYILQSETRESDHFGRYGGEEFLFILFPCESSWAVKTAERLRIAVENNPFVGNDKKIEIKITISLGIATIHSDNDSIEALLNRADKGLYISKESGRNMSTFYDT